MYLRGTAECPGQQGRQKVKTGEAGKDTGSLSPKMEKNCCFVM